MDEYKTIQWNKDVELINYNEVPGDYANLERVINPPKVFKKGDTSKVKYVFGMTDNYKYVVFSDDSVSIVDETLFNTI